MRSRSTEFGFILALSAVAVLAVVMQGCAWQPMHDDRGRQALETSREHLDSRTDLPNLTRSGWSQELSYLGEAYAIIRVTPKTVDSPAASGYEVVVDLLAQEVVAVSAVDD